MFYQMNKKKKETDLNKFENKLIAKIPATKKEI